MTEEQPIRGLDQLQAPAPPPEFWPELHRLLADIDSSIDDNDVSPTAHLGGAAPARGARYAYVAAVAATVIAVVVLAAVVVGRGPAPAVPGSPETAGLIIEDPTVIDLDRWATNPPATAPGPFTVFDVTNLPTGWQVTTAPAGSHRTDDPDPARYRWAGELRSPDGRQIVVSAQTPMAIGTEGGTPVVVHGQQGNVNGDTLSWFDPSGVGLTLTSPDATPEELVAFADALPVTTIPTLPGLAIGDGIDEPPAPITRLSGVIGGIPWTVASADDATTQLSLQTDGHTQLVSGGISRQVTSTWDVTVAGLGNDGTMLYGLAPADITAVRVDLGADVVTLPVAHDDNGVAIYAVPVAPGLRLHQLELVTADRNVRNRVSPPTFLTPSGGGDSFSGQPLNNTFPSRNTDAPDEPSETTPVPPPSNPNDPAAREVSLEEAQQALPDIVIGGPADQQLLELSVQGGYTARVIGHPTELAPSGSDMCISEVAPNADSRTCGDSNEVGGLLVAPGLDVRGEPSFVILTADTVTVTSDDCTPGGATSPDLALTICVMSPGNVEADISFTSPAGPALQVRFTHPDRYRPETTEPSVSVSPGTQGAAPTVWRHGERRGGGLDALIDGTLEYGAERDCFFVTDGVNRYPVVWPAGTNPSADPIGVVLPAGGLVSEGDRVVGGGGYLKVGPEYGIPDECLGVTAEVAVFNPNETITVTGDSNATTTEG